MNIDNDQNGPDPCNSSEPGEDKSWWESGSEGHRFAGVVLQLRIRREIMKFIGSGTKSREEIERNFGLCESLAELHLAMWKRR
jgi:hypothetical protein